MKRKMRSFTRRLAFLTGLFTLLAAGAVAGNVGPVMIQLYGADIDNPSLFWSNIGGGAVGKLSIGTGLSNVAGALTASVTSVFGRTGAVALTSGDVSGALGFTPAAALGYTPVNKAGDTMTGLLGLSTIATASAAGTTQGTATAITAQQTVFTTVGAGLSAVLNSTVNVPQVLMNRGVNPLTVFPFVGAQIEAFALNAAVTVAVGGTATFRCPTATQCYAG